jgi:DnaJ-class molecular chaperone
MFSNMGNARGGARGARGGPIRGEDIQASLQIAFEDAVRGAEKQIELNGRRLTVKIPAGVDTGSRIRLAGQGEPGHRGGPNGDLIIETLVGEHPLVTRDGQDLYLDLPVTVREAALGADVRVPTFGGGGTVSVKPGTQSGTKMRLKGQGVPSLDGGPKGDLYLVVQVKVPEALDDESKRALEKLDRLYRSDVRKDLKL